MIEIIAGTIAAAGFCGLIKRWTDKERRELEYRARRDAIDRIVHLIAKAKTERSARIAARLLRENPHISDDLAIRLAEVLEKEPPTYPIRLPKPPREELFVEGPFR